MKRSCRPFAVALAAGALAVPARWVAQPVVGGVVTVGGGFGGATYANYLRRANPDLDITLVKQNSQNVICPVSDAVIAEMMSLLTRSST
ncbi:MAG: hypothetical protein WAT09_15625 [Paracoccaceae bacterium]